MSSLGGLFARAATQGQEAFERGRLASDDRYVREEQLRAYMDQLARNKTIAEGAGGLRPPTVFGPTDNPYVNPPAPEPAAPVEQPAAVEQVQPDVQTQTSSTPPAGLQTQEADATTSPHVLGAYMPVTRAAASVAANADQRIINRQLEAQEQRLNADRPERLAAVAAARKLALENGLTPEQANMAAAEVMRRYDTAARVGPVSLPSIAATTAQAVELVGAAVGVPIVLGADAAHAALNFGLSRLRDLGRSVAAVPRQLVSPAGLQAVEQVPPPAQPAAGITTKEGVSLEGVKPETTQAMQTAQRVFAEAGAPFTVTSVTDDAPGRVKGSKHGTGHAFDVRMHDVPQELRPQLVERLKQAYGSDYDVVYEDIGKANEHVHIEHDPKGGKGKAGLTTPDKATPAAKKAAELAEKVDATPEEVVRAFVPTEVPNQLSADTQALLDKRAELVRRAAIHRSAYGLSEHDAIVDQIEGIDAKILLQQGRQAVRNAELGDFRLLSSVMSHYYGGATYQFQPLGNDKFHVFVNGVRKTEGEGRSLNKILDIAKQVTDENYRQQVAQLMSEERKAQRDHARKLEENLHNVFGQAALKTIEGRNAYTVEALKQSDVEWQGIDGERFFGSRRNEVTGQLEYFVAVPDDEVTTPDGRKVETFTIRQVSETASSVPTQPQGN